MIMPLFWVMQNQKVHISHKYYIGRPQTPEKKQETIKKIVVTQQEEK